MLKQRGDTLIEVLLAMGVLSLAVVGCMSIMNFSFSSSLDTTMRTKTLALISGQANLLKSARDNYVHSVNVDDWKNIRSHSADPGLAESEPCQVGGNGNSRFYLNANAASHWAQLQTVSGGATGSPQPSLGNGIWVEAYRHNPLNGPDFYDFYIKACWQGNRAQQQLVSVVRLYDPID
ncbi:MAG TPA: prepilin-type N-terminal cleavage/methylation domain-containing protein [Candidatus Saccharimonadales bacterium]|nr:prepilin-type N-terminal cleavage/methylation domain-containing protein [Candidatus Saccharimonadales bacterium]